MASRVYSCGKSGKGGKIGTNSINSIDGAKRGKENHCAYFSEFNYLRIFQTSPRFARTARNRRYNTLHGRRVPDADRRRDGERGNHPEATRFLPWLDFAMWTVHNSPAAMFLFGQVGVFFDWDLCLPAGAIVVVIGFGFWAILQVKRWREETVEFDALSYEEQIGYYQQMVTDGLLDPEEFVRIKAQLETRAGLRTPNPDETPPPANQPPDTSIREK